MNVVEADFALDSLVCWHLTLTLLHVSWIGLLIGLIAAVANRVSKNRSANLRYRLNSVSLLAFAASLPLTFAVVRSISVDDSSAVSNSVTMSVMAPQVGALSPTASADGLAFAPDQPAADFQSERSV